VSNTHAREDCLMRTMKEDKATIDEREDRG